MKILYAASEAVPFIKSGGLADVAGSVTVAVRKRGHACRVVLPLYEGISKEYRGKMKFLTYFNVPLGWRNQYCGVFECTVNGTKFYFLDNEYYFKRHGLYGFFDDGERFAFFSKAVLEMLNYIDFAPEIIHCNDWQTALVPLYLNVYYRQIEKYKNIRTVFTIHNIQYQGTYDLRIATDVLGLPEWAVPKVEFSKDVNFMKAALEECDRITTVSPTYAEEILDPWYGHGLDAFLREQHHKLRGILNGIDPDEYDPEKDQTLAHAFSAADLSGKAKNKADLQRYLGLEVNDEPMIIGMVSRMVSHKGFDLVRAAFPDIMKMNAQFVLLGGNGDYEYERFFSESAAAYKGRASVTLGFDIPLSHRIYAGCDVFLMPSKSEPCGLAQMIAMRYGTIPVVRSTGGLRDSVRDFAGENGNGFDFFAYSSDDMLNALYRAAHDFFDRTLWQKHMLAAMKCDYSWRVSANEYITMYREILS